MLQGMRNVQKTWIGRLFMAVIMGFIVVSFVFWGIGNVFTNYGAGQLATVGKTVISTDAFRSSYQTALQNLQSRNGGRQLTNAQARAAGVPGMVLGKLVSDAALDSAVHRLGLGMGDEDLKTLLKSSPAFKGVDGKFEQARYDAAIRNAGLSPRGFEQDQRTTFLRQQIGEAVSGAVSAPRTVLDALYRYGAEARTIAAMRLPVASAGEVTAPAEDALKAFYEQRKQGYRAPEYRRLVTLAVTPATLARPDEISDADARKRYEEVKNPRFGGPEKRAVQRIVFMTGDEADAASARIKAGASFEEIATERKLTALDMEIGVKSKIDIVDKAIAEAAYGLAQGGVSDPVKSALGPAIVRVNAITEEGYKAYSDVAEELKRELAMGKTGGAVQAAHDKIEDSRTQGKPLTESARAAGFEVRVVDAIDAQGRDKAGAEVPGLSEREALLRAAFASDIGVDNDTVTTKDRGYAWFEVAAIEPSRQRSFEEMRAQVELAWRADEIGKRLAAKTTEFVTRLNAGEKLAAIAASEKLELKTISAIKRNSAEGLSEGERTAVFNVAGDGAGSASGEDGSRLVFQVIASDVPALDPVNAQTKRMLDALSGALANDLLSQYVQRLQADAVVSINDAALAQLTGGDGG